MCLQAVVGGLIPFGGGPEFHPRDTRLLESTDQVVIYILEHIGSLVRTIRAKRLVNNYKLTCIGCS